MRKYSSILAVLLLFLYSITFAHSVVAHEHGEELAVESPEHSHDHHSHDPGHTHTHHGHGHEKEQSATHTLWGFLDHIFAAHSSTSAEGQWTYFSAETQEVIKRTDLQNGFVSPKNHSLKFLIEEDSPDSNYALYRQVHYTFSLHPSITLRGPPILA